MSTIAKLGEEKLQELYDSSSSYSDILRKMKLCPTGGSSRNTLKKYKIIWNIDTKKFKKNFEVLKKNHYKKLQEIRSKDQRSDLDLFKENSEYATYSIKKRIIKRQLIKYECEKCKNKGKWQGEDLGLQLDHINGKSNDHRLENLRFLCPNCHSQTPTFASRNRNPKKCKCGAIIKKDSKSCKKCKKSKTKIDWPSTKELIKMVQELNYVQAAKKLGVSDNAIRKRIKNYSQV